MGCAPRWPPAPLARRASSLRDAAMTPCVWRLRGRSGAHYTVDVDHEDLVRRVRDVTGGEGVDIVINTTGAGTSTVEQGLAAAGRVATIVISDAGNETMRESSFGRRELTIKSSNGHSYRSCERALELIGSGEVLVAALSNPPFGLDHASDAIGRRPGRSCSRFRQRHPDASADVDV